jgi:hypothetical protein
MIGCGRRNIAKLFNEALNLINFDNLASLQGRKGLISEIFNFFY